MKILRTLTRTAKKSLTRKIQEKEERISDSEETIKEIYALVNKMLC